LNHLHILINKVERSKIRLQRLKFVNQVDVKKIIVDEENGYMDIDFLLEETQSGEFKVGAGYSDSSGAIFNVKVQQDNFLGKGNNVALEIEKSSYKKLLRYRNTDPYFTNNGMSKSTTLVLVRLMFHLPQLQLIYLIPLLMVLIIMYQFQNHVLMDMELKLS
jgi:outer membrane protein assembly factor BamA